jgi:hypothetical protein
MQISILPPHIIAVNGAKINARSAGAKVGGGVLLLQPENRS